MESVGGGPGLVDGLTKAANRVRAIADGVTATALDLETGQQVTIAAAYLVGCDGAHSEIRRAIHARLGGDPVVQRTQSSYIRAPDLIRRMQAVPAWSTHR